MKYFKVINDDMFVTRVYSAENELKLIEYLINNEITVIHMSVHEDGMIVLLGEDDGISIHRLDEEPEGLILNIN